MTRLDPLSAILNSLTNPTAKSCLQHEQVEYLTASMLLHAKKGPILCYVDNTVSLTQLDQPMH